MQISIRLLLKFLPIELLGLDERRDTLRMLLLPKCCYQRCHILIRVERDGRGNSRWRVVRMGPHSSWQAFQIGSLPFHAADDHVFGIGCDARSGWWSRCAWAN